MAITRTVFATLVPLLLTAACSDAAALPDRDALSQFDPLPDASEGLTNASKDLDALLEHGELEGACDRYASGEDDERTKLLCGKWMFLYESFGTAGVPEPLVDFDLEQLTDDVGGGFSAFGMIPDPSSVKGYPLGFGPTDPIGSVPALAFTCASCHFARLPDGTYAVGAPNHSYEYGKHVLSLVLPPFLALGVAGDHDPAAVATVQPMIDHVMASPEKSAALEKAVGDLLAGLGVASMTAAFAISPDDEAAYAAWKPGTMDFLIAPLPARDDVLTISAINPLWELPRVEEIRHTHMRHAMLGWTGGTASLMNFLRGFVAFGGGKPELWPEARLTPLADYVYSLRRPRNPHPPPPRDVEHGAALFVQNGCNECHQGPRGSGLDLFSYDEIGTDDAMKRWFDADLDGTGCCGGALGKGDELTHELKSPRLVGLWAMKRFLHNGSVDSLESLFCLDRKRPSVTTPAYSDRGHMFTCATSLTPADRRSLIAFLNSL